MHVWFNVYGFACGIVFDEYGENEPACKITLYMYQGSHIYALWIIYYAITMRMLDWRLFTFTIGELIVPSTIKEPEIGNISDDNSWYFQNSTLADRMASYDTSPGTSLGFHWLFGMLFIFYFYTFFLFTKEVLRPGLSKLLITSHHNL